MSLLNADPTNKKLLQYIEDAQEKLRSVVVSILQQNEDRLSNDGCLVELIDSQQNYFVYQATSLLVPDFESIYIHASEALAIKLNVGLDTVICPDISKIITDPDNIWIKTGIKSAIVIPLHYNILKLGYFIIVSRQSNAFTNSEPQIAKIISGLINAAIIDTIQYLDKMQKDIIICECEDQIQISQERQSLIFNSIHDAIIILDSENKIVDWNPAAKEIFGYNKEEVLGKTFDMFVEDEHKYIALEINESISQQKEWKGELYIVRKDGVKAYYEMNIVLLKKEDGQVIALLSIGRDITDKHQEQIDLKSKISLFKTALQQIDQTVAIMNESGVFYSNKMIVTTDFNDLEWHKVISDGNIICIKK